VYADECSAQDDRTLKITLKRPIAIFIDAIARGGASVAFIMPEHIAKTDPFKQIPETIGSGPYKFRPDEFIAGAHAAYARNPDYVPRQEAADWMIGGKVAHFERIEWRVIPIRDRRCRITGQRDRLRAGATRSGAAAAA
jgi:peptide/nickel transport system substrate-binding protein